MQFDGVVYGFQAWYLVRGFLYVTQRTRRFLNQAVECFGVAASPRLWTQSIVQFCVSGEWGVLSVAAVGDYYSLLLYVAGPACPRATWCSPGRQSGTSTLPLRRSSSTASKAQESSTRSVSLAQFLILAVFCVNFDQKIEFILKYWFPIYCAVYGCTVYFWLKDCVVKNYFFISEDQETLILHW